MSNYEYTNELVNNHYKKAIEIYLEKMIKCDNRRDVIKYARKIKEQAQKIIDENTLIG